MKLGPYVLGPTEDENQGVYTGDARILSEAIPDESVDLIFTDPVYQNIDDYRWLAETAARVLKNGGALLVWCSKLGQFDVKLLIEEHLPFALPLSYIVYGKAFRLMYFQTFMKTTPLLWFYKGKPSLREWIVDSIVCHYGNTRFPDAINYKWAKHPDVLIYYINKFTTAENAIFDPFTGGGTVPAVCKMLSRHWLAFEINPDVAEAARQRVCQTQPPLPGLVVKQMELMKEGQHG